MSSLELIGIDKKTEEKDENGKKIMVNKTEEINILGLRNTEKIQNILDNPDNYSADYLFNLDKENLYGVSSELRNKLIKLGIEKITKEYKERLTDEGYGTGEEE